jgi:hypothetical protein
MIGLGAINRLAEKAILSEALGNSVFYTMLNHRKRGGYVNS